MIDKIKIFVKKYISLIIPGAILVLAILLLIPTWLIGGSIKEKMQKRVRELESINRMVDDIPSQSQYEQEKSYQDKLEQQANAIEQSLIATSQRELISYKVLPEPQDTSTLLFVDFGEEYRRVLGDLVGSIGALDAPTSAEIRNVTSRGADTGGGRGRGRYSSRRGGQEDPLAKALAQKRANETSVYANPDIFKWYNFWEDYQYVGPDTALKDVWYSQVAYWIYEDVIKSIGAVNGDSQRVSDSAVKRLIGVSFTETSPDYASTTERRSTSSTSGDIFEYVKEDDEVSILGVKPWTGRYTNDDLDVIHFSVSVIAGARSIDQFIMELCKGKEHTFRKDYNPDGERVTLEHNQITVLNYKHSAIDQDGPEHDYYVYGDEAVVRLDLVCEYFFYKEGYAAVKPEPIKILTGELEAEDDGGGRSRGRSRRR